MQKNPTRIVLKTQRSPIQKQIESDFKSISCESRLFGPKWGYKRKRILYFRSFWTTYKILWYPGRWRSIRWMLRLGLGREAAREYWWTEKNSCFQVPLGYKKSSQRLLFSLYPGRDLNPHAVAGSRFWVYRVYHSTTRACFR